MFLTVYMHVLVHVSEYIFVCLCVRIFLYSKLCEKSYIRECL